MFKIIRIILQILCIGCFGGYALSAESIEDSSDELAKSIVQKSENFSGDIAIYTITHSDNTCSKLSNFLSEELLDSLFDASDDSFSIIERFQLGGFFRELNLEDDGTIVPDAAKELGRVKGVGAIVVGRITDLGERVVFRARLISTNTGRVFASAKSNFPKTSSIATLMKERSHALCGYNSNFSINNNAGTSSKSAVDSSDTLAAPKSAIYSTPEFDAHISNLNLSGDGESVSTSIRFINKTQNLISLSYIKSSLNVVSNRGATLKWKELWSGLANCGNSSFRRCADPNDIRAVGIATGKALQHNFDLIITDAGNTNSLTIAMELVINPNASRQKWRKERITFYDVPLQK